MRHAWIFLFLCWVCAATPASGAEFHIGGPTIELRRLQHCTECDNPLVVTTIAPGAAVRCPHCTSVQRRLPDRLLEERVYQVCPSCASRLDVAHLDPMQQLRCGTCGLAQYVLPEAVHRPDSRAGTGRVPAAHWIEDTDGRPPTWKESQGHRERAAPSVAPGSSPDPQPGSGSGSRMSPPPAAGERMDGAPSRDSGARSAPGRADRHAALPPFDPRDPATLELYLEQEDALRSNRERAMRAPSGNTAPLREELTPRAPAARMAPARFTEPGEVASTRPHERREAASIPEDRPAKPESLRSGSIPPQSGVTSTEFASVSALASTPDPGRGSDFPPETTSGRARDRQPPFPDPTGASVQDRSLLHAANVNGHPILVADVERTLREAMEAMQVELGAEAHTQAGQVLLAGQRIVLQEKILDTLIGRELIRQAALREGYRPDEQAAHDFADALAAERGHPRSHALLEEARFQLILEDMHRRHARITEPVRPGEVRAYYEANLDAFREPARVKLRHLVIFRNRDGRPDSRSASVIAGEVARKLRNGADYEALVHRYSEGPFRDQGGESSMGQEAQTPLANLTRAVRVEVNRKDEGDVVGPVETVSAVVFARIEIKRPAAPRPFGEVAESIRQQLVHERRNAAFETWVEELRKGARIEKTRF